MERAKKLIFHIDVNSAFLSWEAAYRIHHLGEQEDLRREPSAVGGDTSKRRGIILAKSVPAKEYGVKTGQTILEAKERCPGLLLVPPDYGLYERCSKAFLEILSRHTPDVEPYSIDEAYLDMTKVEGVRQKPWKEAEAIRQEIREELGFTVNIGISENKLLAKMASDFRKPDRVHTLWKKEIPKKLWQLPVGRLFFVGPATERKLLQLGIQTIGELAGSDRSLLKAHLKKHGELIWAFANGMDVSVVQSDPPRQKGYGNSTTIAFDVTDASTARLALLGLAETMAGRLRAASVRAEVLTVTVRYFDFRFASRQGKLDNPTNITIELHRRACCLFEQLWDGSPIRHLGIHTERLWDSSPGRQLTLFDFTDYGKLERLDGAVDQIRRRYGSDAVRRASFLQKGLRLDHMAGGLPGEKKPADEGNFRRKQEEVACSVWFTSTGKMMPQYLKYRTEEGILETISGIRILSCEKKHYCGITAAEYRCSALFRGEQRLFRLYYYPEQGKWKLSWE